MAEVISFGEVIFTQFCHEFPICALTLTWRENNNRAAIDGFFCKKLNSTLSVQLSYFGSVHVDNVTIPCWFCSSLARKQIHKIQFATCEGLICFPFTRNAQICKIVY